MKGLFDKKRDKIYWQRGQTLNEAIIAVLLLTFGVIGMLGAVVSSLGRMEIVGDRATATFLAAEGIEVAKNIVDGRSLRNGTTRTDPFGVNWNADFQVVGNYYQLDYKDINSTGKRITNPGNFDPSDGISSGERSGMTFLNYDKVTGLYGYAGGGNNVSSKFKRAVGVESVSSGNALRLVSYVTWADRRGNWQIVKTETYLFNWR